MGFAPCKGNYDGPVTLSNDSRFELEWWVHNITSSFMPITQDKPDFVLTTDASKIGWGAVCGDNKTVIGVLIISMRFHHSA